MIAEKLHDNFKLTSNYVKNLKPRDVIRAYIFKGYPRKKKMMKKGTTRLNYNLKKKL